MNLDILGGKWKQLRGRARMKWGALTGNPFHEFDGQQDTLNGKIQELRGRARAPSSRRRPPLLLRVR